MKPIKKTLILITLVSLILLFCFLGAGILLFPRVLQDYILPGISDSAGVKHFSCGVRHVGLYGADFENIRLGTPDAPGISIDSLRIDYSPSGILNKSVGLVRLDGITLHADYRNGLFSIPGLFPSEGAGKTSRDELPPAETAVPIALEKLVLANGRLLLDTENGACRIPFHIEAKPTPDMRRVLCRARVHPFGQNVETDVGIDLAHRAMDIFIHANAMALGAFSGAQNWIGGLKATGTADLRVKAGIRWSPFTLDSFETEAGITDADISFENIRIAPFMAGGSKEDSAPLKISVARQSGTTWKMNLSGLALSAPLPVQVKALAVEVNAQQGVFTGTGDVQAVLMPYQPVETVSLTSPLPVSCAGDFSYQNSTSWSIDMENADKGGNAAPTDIGGIKIGDFVIRSAPQGFQLSARGDDNGIATAFSLTADNVYSTNGPARIETGTVSVKGEAALRSGENPRLNLTGRALNMQIQSDDGKINCSKLDVSGRIEHLGSPDMQISGDLAASKADAVLPSQSVEARGISLDLPFTWPGIPNPGLGGFEIKNILFDNMDMGRVLGSIRQTGLSLDFEGTHQSRLIPDFTITFSGKSELLEHGEGIALHLAYKNSPYKTPFPLDLGRFTPAAAGITLAGRVDLSGDVSYANGKFDARLSGGLSDASLTYTDMDLAVNGLTTQIDFPDLKSLRSAPKQRFEFSSATLGVISLNHGFMEYQMEAMDSLLIEKAGFNWCSGRVDTHALRIIPGKNNYDIVLYCDRLNLAMLLEQFGAADAEGKGTVNGRIPLSYSGGRLVFQDGFLYSTPGKGGRIRMRNTENLLAGVPPGTPEYMQMDLASEVLKSYDYNWATLGLETEGSDLMMRLSFDGKPTNPLPFVYQKDIGGFMKLEAGMEGSVFQGVNLDINFRLPLDALLQYREVFNMIQ